MTFINRNIVEQEINRIQNDQDFQKVVSNIKAGKFVRDTNNADYNDRVVYTKVLRTFVYNQAVLNVVFGEQELKEKFFRAFGYNGKVKFTIYPKCWLRDLPLLDIGENVYLGDNILLGTNQVTPDQKKLVVGKIQIGDNCIFNQGCTLAGKSSMGNDCIVGFETAIGFGNTIGNNTNIGERVTVGHCNKIGSNVTIGYMCKIGRFCVIEDGVEIEEMTNIPSYSLVTKNGIFSRRKKSSKIASIKTNTRTAVA
jgi:NDP-sugar pyrophosphorylase family protein